RAVTPDEKAAGGCVPGFPQAEAGGARAAVPRAGPRQRGGRGGGPDGGAAGPPAADRAPAPGAGRLPGNARRQGPEADGRPEEAAPRERGGGVRVPAGVAARGARPEEARRRAEAGRPPERTREGAEGGGRSGPGRADGGAAEAVAGDDGRSLPGVAPLRPAAAGLLRAGPRDEEARRKGAARREGAAARTERPA